jgi:glycosyltransferase involved in cell wall biosynthesis
MNSTLPSLSLVTCSFQQGKFIGSTLASVLSQQYPGLEYIVVDGGSTDGSVQTIKAHADQLAHWVSEPDSGQTDALAKGFARSSGEVMGWLCSDDLLLPGALHAVGRWFADHPKVDWLYGDAIWINGSGEPIRTKREMDWNRHVFLFDHNYLAQPSVFWRRRLYDAAGGLDRSFNLAMDSDLWLRFARIAKPSHLARYLSCMRYYPEQKTRALKPNGMREDELLRRREAPTLAGWPRAPLHLLARAQRFASKAVKGGYTAQVPAHLLPWLQQMKIP